MSLQYVVNSLRTKKCYFYFLAFQLVIMIAITAYVFNDIHTKHKDIVPVILELVVTAIVFIEIFLRLWVLGTIYFKNWLNIMDLLMMTAVIGLYVALFVVENSNVQEYDEDTDVCSVLLGIRYMIQIVRVIYAMKQNTAIRRAAKMDIDINMRSTDYIAL